MEYSDDSFTARVRNGFGMLKVKLQHCLLRRRKSSDVGEDMGQSRQALPVHLSSGLCRSCHFLGLISTNVIHLSVVKPPFKLSPVVSRSWRKVSRGSPVLGCPTRDTSSLISFRNVRNSTFVTSFARAWSLIAVGSPSPRVSFIA
jgi:hypothetical protein